MQVAATAPREQALVCPHRERLHGPVELDRQLPGLLEVSIGHALTVDALYLGLSQAVSRYRASLESSSNN